MKTICTCGREGHLQRAQGNGEFVFEGDQVAIDQENNVEYQSLCAQCYFAEREKFYQRHPKVHI